LPANEDELQQEFARAFQENKFNVVYVASTNITRIFGIYRAAVQTGRVFLVDKYQKTIMDIINNYKTSAPYYHYDENHEPMELFPDFKVVPKFINLLTKQGYVLIARANPQFDTFKKEIPGPQTTYLSMWQGYMQSGPAANAALQASIDDTYLYMHVSGHCTVDDLKKLMELLQPHTVIPMHTDDPEQVRLELGDKVRVLQDGEALTLNSCQK
jgi:ribonuclease J